MESETRVFAIKNVNLHTHSWYCGHGEGELAEYVDVAIADGLQVLGFSEHGPMPNERWAMLRMPFSLLDSYIDECKTLQRTRTEITLLTGLECDYDPSYHSWYKEYLLGDKEVDYLSFAVHFLQHPTGRDEYLQRFPSEKKYLHAYTDAYIEGLSSGLFSFGVHPDLFGCFYREWDDETIACSRSIFECACSYHIPLEINASGLHKPPIDTSKGNRSLYPLVPFWTLAKEYPLTIIGSSDAHKPQVVKAFVDDAHAFAKKINLNIDTSFIIDRNGKISFSV